jgi:polyisoprenoid-binding protein YceI
MKLNKSLSLTLGIVVAMLIMFYSCKSKTPVEVTEAESVTTTLAGSGEIYLVDTVTSVIEWVGATPGNYKHNGTIKLSKGQFTVNNNQLTSGEFTININSITNLDQQGKDKTNLEGHLKEKDFFEVEKFPFGNFKITGQKVIGNLTLKDKTNSIAIPVTLVINEKSVSAETPSFTIDRTKWGIVYNSGIIGTIKDDLINDEIELKMKIVAGKGH